MRGLGERKWRVTEYEKNMERTREIGKERERVGYVPDWLPKQGP